MRAVISLFLFLNCSIYAQINCKNFNDCFQKSTQNKGLELPYLNKAIELWKADNGKSALIFVLNEKAKVFISNNQKDSALKTFDEIISQEFSAKTIAVSVLRKAQLKHNENLEKIVAEIDTALQSHNNINELRLLKGDILRDLKKEDEALIVYRQAALMADETALDLLYASNVGEIKEEVKKSIDDDKLFQLHFNWLNEANQFNHDGEYSKAISRLLKAIKFFDQRNTKKLLLATGNELISAYLNNAQTLEAIFTADFLLDQQLSTEFTFLAKVEAQKKLGLPKANILNTINEGLKVHKDSVKLAEMREHLELK